MEQRESLLAATPVLGEAIHAGGDPGGDAAFTEGLAMIIAGAGVVVRASGTPQRP